MHKTAETEQELEEIFEEKLYVSKKPLADISNCAKKRNLGLLGQKEPAVEEDFLEEFGGKAKEQSLGYKNEKKMVEDDIIYTDIQNGYLTKGVGDQRVEHGGNRKILSDEVRKHSQEVGNKEKINTFQYRTKEQLEVKYENSHNPVLPKETTLLGIYDDAELQGALNTEERNSKKTGDKIENNAINTLQMHGFASNGENGEVKHNKAEKGYCVHKEKLQILEIEFQKMIQSHKDTLRMKSKIYRFIYGEIQNLRNEFTTKIRTLEEENNVLKEENEEYKRQIEKQKLQVSRFNQKVKEEATKWKLEIEKKVKEYIQSIKK